MKDKILHVDGDAFFAACEMARLPKLWGKPVVVGTTIAAAMSYSAKSMGVHRAMPIFKIKKVFPDITIVYPHFELYQMYSDKLYSILLRFTDKIERYSIDECFAVLSYKDMQPYGSWGNFLQTIKDEVQKNLGITYSFGLADTKVLAKVASKYHKPNGMTYIEPTDLYNTLVNVPIEQIWGIGRALSKKLKQMNIVNAGQFAKLSAEYMYANFNKPVVELWYEINGKSVLSLSCTDIEQPKSLQSMRTFAPATNDHAYVWSEFSTNVENVCQRLRNINMLAKSVEIFLKEGQYNYTTNVCHLLNFTNNPSDILKWVKNDFDVLYKKGVLYRQTGVSVGNLCPESMVQADLFDSQKNILNSRGYTSVVDALRAKHGKNIIGLLSSLSSKNKKKGISTAQNISDNYVWGLPLPYLGEVS